MKIPYRNPWIVGALVVIVVGVVWWFYSRSSETSTQPVTERVSRGMLVRSVTGTGSVIAKIQADVKVSGQGRIEELLVLDGQQVQADQPLLRVKSLATEEEIAKAYASLLSSTESLTKAQQSLQDAQKNENIAQLTLNGSQLTYDKTKVDAEKTVNDARKGIIDAASTQLQADTDLEVVAAETSGKSAGLSLKSAEIKAKTDLKTAEASLEQAKRDADSISLKTKSAQQSLDAARASLRANQLSYQSLTNQMITAPVSGMVMNLSLVEGSMVGGTSAGSSTSESSATSIFSIVDLNSLRAQVAINEVDITEVKVGQVATLTFDALSGKTVTGSVASIDRLGTTTQGVTTYNVEISLDTIDESIRPGMTASANIITEQKDNALLVSNGAIRPQGNQNVVEVVNGGVSTIVPVTLGFSNDVQTEVIEGLQEDDEVVTSQASTTNSTGAFSGRSSTGRSVRGGTVLFGMPQAGGG